MMKSKLSDLSAPLCPCCSETMRNEPAHNALSRFRDIYICSRCGVREAMEGDFWRELYKNEERVINIQDNAWREAWKMERLSRKEHVLMRFDISAQRIKEHGPGYRPQDGDTTRVHPDSVQDMRDKGWQIIRKQEHS